MFFHIDYNYNTGVWHAEPSTYGLWLFGLHKDPDRVIYVGF